VYLAENLDAIFIEAIKKVLPVLLDEPKVYGLFVGMEKEIKLLNVLCQSVNRCFKDEKARRDFIAQNLDEAIHVEILNIMFALLHKEDVKLVSDWRNPDGILDISNPKPEDIPTSQWPEHLVLTDKGKKRLNDYLELRQ